MNKLASLAGAVASALLSATFASQPASATMAPADDYVGVDAPRQFFVNVSSLVLFRSDPSPFTILRYGDTPNNAVDIFNATDLDYGPGFGVDVELGGLFGDSNIGFLAGGFVASPFVATYEAPVPSGALLWILTAGGSSGSVANSLLGTGETTLHGFDANLMFQLTPAVAAYAASLASTWTTL